MAAAQITQIPLETLSAIIRQNASCTIMQEVSNFIEHMIYGNNSGRISHTGTGGKAGSPGSIFITPQLTAKQVKQLSAYLRHCVDKNFRVVEADHNRAVISSSHCPVTALNADKTPTCLTKQHSCPTCSCTIWLNYL